MRTATLILPAALRDVAGGRDQVDLDGCATVGEALDALRTAAPAVYERIVTERGEVRPHVNLFIGSEDVRNAGGLAAPLPADGQIVVLPAVSGG